MARRRSRVARGRAASIAAPCRAAPSGRPRPGGPDAWPPSPRIRRARVQGFFPLTGSRPGIDAHRSSWEWRLFGTRASGPQMGRRDRRGSAPARHERPEDALFPGPLPPSFERTGVHPREPDSAAGKDPAPGCATGAGFRPRRGRISPPSPRPRPERRRGRPPTPPEVEARGPRRRCPLPARGGAERPVRAGPSDRPLLRPSHRRLHTRARELRAARPKRSSARPCPAGRPSGSPLRSRSSSRAGYRRSPSSAR